MSEQQPWHVALFKKSVLKQAKLRNILRVLGPTDGLRCLDLGSDNGVISFFLREAGGTWASADLNSEAVESIRSLVADDVHLIDGSSLPFRDGEFDRIVVVDMLEHVEDDVRLITELARVLKPEGLLVVNVPNLKICSPLRFLRHLIGQTDEAHGHLRPGYSEVQLKSLSDGAFTVLSSRTYSRFFSELIDTMLVGCYQLLSGRSKDSGEFSKGLIVTQDSMSRFKKKFRLYSAIYPLVLALSWFDLLIPFVPGYMRITLLQRRSTAGRLKE